MSYRQLTGTYHAELTREQLASALDGAWKSKGRYYVELPDSQFGFQASTFLILTPVEFSKLMERSAVIQERNGEAERLYTIPIPERCVVGGEVPPAFDDKQHTVSVCGDTAKLTPFQYRLVKLLSERRSEYLETLRKKTAPTMSVKRFVSEIAKAQEKLEHAIPWVLSVIHRKHGGSLVTWRSASNVAAF